MKKINILFLSILISNVLYAQIIRFNKRYDLNNQVDVSRGIVEVDGGYIVAGGTDPTRIFTMFIDTLGNKKWVKTFQFPGWPWSYIGMAGAMIKTNDNNIAIAGQLKADTNYAESLLMKMNIFGDTLWSKSYRLNYPYYYSGASQCIQTFDNGYVITGGYDGLSSTINADFLLIKTDINGVLQWWKNYGDNKTEIAYSVIQTPEKGYLMGGTHYYGSGGYQYYDPKIVKTDSLGNFKWDKLMGSSLKDNAAFVCMAKDSNYMVAYTAGEYEPPGFSYRKINVNKLDTAGNIIWSKKYGPTYINNNLTQIKLMPDGGFLACGFTDHPQFTWYQVGWLLRINADGDSLWYREYANYVHNDMFNQLWDMYITKDKGIVATGPLYPNPNNGTQDIWVIKTDSMGCIEPNCDGVGFIEIMENKGMLFYPNPAQYKITINLNGFKNIEGLNLSIYNIQGQMLIQQTLKQNKTEIDISQLQQGLYIAKIMLSDGSFVQERFVVIK